MNNPDYIYGMHPVMEAIKSNKDIDKIFIQSDLRGPHITELRKLIKQSGISSQNLPLGRLNHMYKKNHQGVVAFLSPIEYQPYQAVIQQVFESGKDPLVLILDRVSDVGNFGAICRTVECMGVDVVIIPVKGSAPLNSEAIKRSSGALLTINLCKEKDLAAVCEDLKGSGLRIIGCTEKAEDSVFEMDYTGPTAIVMGSEEDGINSTIMKQLDGSVRIPLQGDIASLNVSVAAGIILAQALKQRIGA